jgi:hypothetical protein
MSKNILNVKSSLFTSDPVAMRNSKTPGAGNRGSPLFIKGDKNSTFELKKGYDNIYIVKSGDGRKFEIDRNGFINRLSTMKNHCQVQIRALGKNETELFTSLVEAIGMLRDTGKLYQMIHEDIRKMFDDVKIVIPGTVAAYFIGCSSNDNFPGPIGCNPKCAASLAPGEKDPGYSTCKDLVLTYNDAQTFDSLNQEISAHAYIYTGLVDFKGFTQENVKQLTDAGISSVTLIYGNVDGVYKEIVPSLTMDKLPLKAELQQTTSTDVSSNGAVAFAIIIVIIIIILLILLYQSSVRTV